MQSPKCGRRLSVGFLRDSLAQPVLKRLLSPHKTLLLTFSVFSVAPLKGIPKQAPFRSPTTPSVFSPSGNRTPIPPSRTPLQKERGVKVGHPFSQSCQGQVLILCSVIKCGMCLFWQLLDISELNTVGAGREAKRRRKTLGV